MTKLTKKKSQSYHARGRAMRRYGIFLNRDRRVAIIEAIQSGRSVHVNKITNRLSLHFVNLEGVCLPIVYDKTRQSIATVLPKKVLYRYMPEYRTCQSDGNVTGT